MDNRGGPVEELELPENGSAEFDEKALEEAIRNHRRDEFAALAQLNR